MPSSAEDGADAPATDDWLTQQEWSVLHAQIRPNPRSVGEFRLVVRRGQLGVYTRGDMDKVLRQLKTFLRSRGRLADAESVVSNGRINKPELAKEIQRLAVTKESSVPLDPGAAAIAAWPDTPRSLQRENPPQPSAEGACIAQRTRHHRALHTTDGDRDRSATPASALVGAAEQQVKHSPPPPRRLIASSSGDDTRVDAAGHSSAAAGAELAAAAGAVPMSQGRELITKLRVALVPHKWVGAVPGKPLQRNHFERYQSPLLEILHCIHRLPLRLGVANKSFAIPPEYVQQVAERKLRIVLFPVDGVSFSPSAWPAVKELAMSINRMSVGSSFRRNWPSRKHELPKSYLTYDATSLITRAGGTQNVHLDCFARDYYAMIVIAVAKPVAEGKVAADYMSRVEVKGSHTNYIATKALYGLYSDTIEEGFGKGVDEDDVVVDTVASTVSLKDPITQMRVRIPARGKDCTHLQCFDLEGALRNCHTACYWSCPLCDKSIVLGDIVVDKHLQEALAIAPPDVKALRHVPTPEDPFRWVTALVEEDDDDDSQGGRSPNSRGNDSLDILLATSSDDEDGEGAQRPPGSATAASSGHTFPTSRGSRPSGERPVRVCRYTGSSADPITID